MAPGRGKGGRRGRGRGGSRSTDAEKDTWQLPARNQLKDLVQGRIFTPKDFDFGPCVGKGSLATVRIATLLGQDRGDEKVPMAIKIMSKNTIVGKGQMERIKLEKQIWETLDSPYVVTFLSSFQDPRRAFLVLEFVHGGDLYGRLKGEGRLPPDHGRYYTCELVLALRYLGAKCVAYRDLKPENLLIDKNGHMKICDFGFAKILPLVDGDHELTYSIVGTPEYLAPEIIQQTGHTMSVDIWALGVIIFEMLTGYPPFFDESPFEIYRKVLALEIPFPRHFDVKAKNLLNEGLLVHDRHERLDWRGIVSHNWFDYVEWENLTTTQGLGVQPPWKPTVADAQDTRMFEVIPDDVAGDRYEENHPIMKRENAPFVGVF